MSYYYANSSGTERLGPCDIKFLKRLYLEGELHDMTLVWTEGQKNWEPLKATKFGAEIMLPLNVEAEIDAESDCEESQSGRFSLSKVADEVRANEAILDSNDATVGVERGTTPSPPAEGQAYP